MRVCLCVCRLLWKELVSTSCWHGSMRSSRSVSSMFRSAGPNATSSTSPTCVVHVTPLISGLTLLPWSVFFTAPVYMLSLLVSVLMNTYVPVSKRDVHTWWPRLPSGCGMRLERPVIICPGRFVTATVLPGIEDIAVLVIVWQSKLTAETVVVVATVLCDSFTLIGSFIIK